MCFTVVLSESWRRVFGLTTTVLNGVLLLLALVLVIAGIALRVKLDARLKLLEDYNPGALPILLMVTGGLLFFTHLIACKFCYDATYVETRSSYHYRFIALIIFLVILCVYVFIAEIVTLVHSSKIEDALERGISNLMQVYMSDLQSKERIDTIQLEFTCCGVHSYNDWFKIAWVNLAYLNTTNPEVQTFIKDGKFIKDDAPFSCCNRFSKFACIHHSVINSTRHQAQQLTLSEEGCASAISNYFHESLIAPTAILILFILIFQVIAISLMRLLQTSISSADELGDPEADGAAYCIQAMGVGKDNRSYFKVQQKDEGDDDEGSDEDDDEISDDEDEKESGVANVMGKMKSKFRKASLPWKRRKSAEDDDDDDDGKSKGRRKADRDDERKSVGGNGKRKADRDDGEVQSKKSKYEEKEEKRKAKEEKKAQKKVDKEEKKAQKKKDTEEKKKGKTDKKEQKKKDKEEKKKEKSNKKEEKKKDKEEKKKKKSNKKEEKKKDKEQKKNKKEQKKKEKEEKKKKKTEEKKRKKEEKKRKKEEKKRKKKEEKKAKKEKKKKK